MDEIFSLIKQRMEDRKKGEPFLISIGGAGGCGKSTFVKKLASFLNTTAILELDHYKTPREERYPKRIFGADPQANECDLIVKHLKELKKNGTIERPYYCSTAGRATHSEKFLPAEIILIDGEISSYEQFRLLCDLSIFIDSSLKTQLKTRFSRDIKERGYSAKKALETFIYSNVKEFRKYGLPTKEFVDIVLFCDSNYTLSLGPS